MNKVTNIKTLGIDELSILIFRAVPTIKNDLYRKPKSLPPRIVIPGSKKLVWFESDVLNWLEQCREVIEPPKAVVKEPAVSVNHKVQRRF